MAVKGEAIDAAMRDIQSGIDRYPHHENYIETFPVPTRTQAQCIAVNRFVVMGRVRILSVEVGKARLETTAKAEYTND